ncbi:hypothetical protein HDU93_004948, partial [Gonapodya sp. JEL0774]
VIVTQPRRISAVALAERVAWERGEKVGLTVGYTIRGETVRSAKTRLIFATTGVLLRRLQEAAGKGGLKGVGCIVVDEVHERGIDSDFLLILLRDILPVHPKLRVVLMSATVDADTFATYFGGVPVLSVPGFTYPVRDLLLADVRQMLRKTDDHKMKGVIKNSDKNDLEDESDNAEYPSGPQRMIVEEGKIDYQLVADVVRHISESGDPDIENTDNIPKKATAKLGQGILGAILIFMPGVVEIRRCIETLRSTLSDGTTGFEFLPLHANLSQQEQMSVFRSLKRGVRRVVVATNVAETSVTIDGVVHVIDTGRVKETKYDPQTRMQSLVETWCSRASAKQRRGRAGRVCYKLFSKNVATQIMEPFSIPEILRTPLEQLCLSIKAMSIPLPEKFLSKAPTPPPVEAVEAAMDILREVSAIDGETGELTALGRHMANIPVDLRIAKFLVIGAAFSCVESVTGIAACLSGKSPFVSPVDKRAEAEAARSRFSLEKSDLLTDLRAFEEWSELRKGAGKGREREYCDLDLIRIKNFLSRNALLTAADMKDQYLAHLTEIGFLDKSYFTDANVFARMNGNSKNWKVVKAVILAGLYPQILKIRHPETTYTQTLSGTVAQPPKPHQFRFFTRDHGRVFLHPSSINFSQSRYEADSFACFNALVNTSKVFARDVSVVSSGWPILLFGGRIRVDHVGGLVTVGGWMVMRSFARIGVLANGLRRALDQVLAMKIENPKTDISESEVIRLIVDILSKDGT